MKIWTHENNHVAVGSPGSDLTGLRFADLRFAHSMREPTPVRWCRAGITTTICPQTYERKVPLGNMRSILTIPLKPLEHHGSMIPRGLTGALNWAAIMRKGASFSDSQWNKCSSGVDFCNKYPNMGTTLRLRKNCDWTFGTERLLNLALNFPIFCISQDINAGSFSTITKRTNLSINNRAFRLVVRSLFVLTNSNCDWLK